MSHIEEAFVEFARSGKVKKEALAEFVRRGWVEIDQYDSPTIIGPGSAALRHVRAEP